MNVYKLKYSDRETAVADLKAKELLLEEGMYGIGVHAIVELGLILLDETTFADGYHYDIMCEQDVDFGENSIIVHNPKHGFLGH
jgi:hypothetical protein